MWNGTNGVVVGDVGGCLESLENNTSTSKRFSDWSSDLQICTSTFVAVANTLQFKVAMALVSLQCSCVVFTATRS